MIDINKLFIRLLEDLEESSPNLRKSLKEISPLEFCINIKAVSYTHLTLPTIYSV